MPRDHGSVVRRFNENLIVPKSHRSVQKDLGATDQAGDKDEIVKCLGNPPSPQRVEQFTAAIILLVQIVFIEKCRIDIRRIHQLLELVLESGDLLGAQHRHAENESVALEICHAFAGDQVCLIRRIGQKQARHLMVFC